MEVKVPDCGEQGNTEACFPISNGVATQEADIQLAWSRMSKYSSNRPLAYAKPRTVPRTRPTSSTGTTSTGTTGTTSTTGSTGTTSTTDSTPTTGTTTTTTTTSSATKKQWGAFLPNSAASDVASLEATVGAPLNIRAVFVGWGSGAGDFPSWLTSTLQSGNKTLMIYWEPAANGDTGTIYQPNYNYDSINSGAWDSYIISFAKSVKNYGGQVIMIPFDEMNGDWYPWSGTNNNNSPAKHNVAYQRLHDLFAAQGVTNVKWGWAPNNDSWPNTAANDLTMYYPGDAYVDYVGVDGFNFNNPWLSFTQVFGTALGKLARYNKPIYIFSMASAEANDGGTKKAAWITDAFSQIAKNPNIAGWVWFNENKEQNWLLNSNTNVLNAFSTIVKSYK